MKTRGMILEVDKNTVTVLTPDGRFCRLPRVGQVDVGQEYSYRNSLRPWLAAAAIFVLLFVSSIYPLSASQAVAYVSLDINPSLELGVSSNLQVLSAQALNPEAEDLVADIELKGMSLSDALQLLLQAAEEKQYLTEDSPAVVLTGTPAGNRNHNMSEIQDLLEDTVKQYNTEHATSVVAAVVTSNRQARDEAKELGLSVGKYAVLLEAREEGLELDAEDLREKGIGRALLDLEIQPKDVLRRVHRKKQKPETPTGKEKEQEERPGKGVGRDRDKEPDSETGNNSPVNNTVPAGGQRKPFRDSDR